MKLKRNPYEKKDFWMWCASCKHRLEPETCLACIRDVIGRVAEPSGYSKA